MFSLAVKVDPSLSILYDRELIESAICNAADVFLRLNPRDLESSSLLLCYFTSTHLTALMFSNSARVGPITGQNLVEETIRFVEEIRKNNSSLVAIVGGPGESKLYHAERRI